MPRYIITYDLSKPGRNYGDLYKRIKSYSTWAKITESSWAVSTDRTAEQIRDNLKEALDSNDKLLMGLLGRSAWSGLTKELTDWLKENR